MRACYHKKLHVVLFIHVHDGILYSQQARGNMAHTWDVYNGQTRVASVQAFSAADAIQYVEQQVGVKLVSPIAIPLDGE